MAIVKDPLHSQAAAGPVGTALHRSVQGRGVVSQMPTKLWVDSTKRRMRIDALKALSPLWRELSDAQRTAWATFAALFHQQDRFNRAYLLSGYSAFIRTNSLYDLMGRSYIDNPPAWATPLRISNPTARSEYGDIRLSWDCPEGVGAPPGGLFIRVHYRPSMGRAADRASAILCAITAISPPEFLLEAQPEGKYTFWFTATHYDSAVQLPELHCDLLHSIP